MQIISKHDTCLYVRLDTPFEKFAFEQTEDDFISLLNVHFGFPSSTAYLGFQKDETTTDLYLKFDLGYYYQEDFNRFRRNGCLSHYTSKKYTSEKLQIKEK